jgi:hypothetical protein
VLQKSLPQRATTTTIHRVFTTTQPEVEVGAEVGEGAGVVREGVEVATQVVWVVIRVALVAQAAREVEAARAAGVPEETVRAEAPKAEAVAQDMTPLPCKKLLPV